MITVSPIRRTRDHMANDNDDYDDDSDDDDGDDTNYCYYY